MTYSTCYSTLSETDLQMLFTADSWQSMSPHYRREACQEVENRLAEKNGVAPCKVTMAPIIGGTFGVQRDGIITLNSYFLLDGVFWTEGKDENGETLYQEVKAPAPNWNAYDTILHEGTHGISEAKGQMPRTYFHSEYSDRDIYRIQHEEKAAYAAGQSGTLDAIMNVINATGQDITPDMREYKNYIKTDSFDSALQNAIEHYNDPDIEKTVAQVIYDRDHGIVCSNPSQSYTAINSLYEISLLRAALDRASNHSQTSAAAHVISNGEGSGSTLSEHPFSNNGAETADDGSKLDIRFPSNAGEENQDDGSKLDIHSFSNAGAENQDDGSKLDIRSFSNAGAENQDDGSKLDIRSLSNAGTENQDDGSKLSNDGNFVGEHMNNASISFGLC